MSSANMSQQTPTTPQTNTTTSSDGDINDDPFSKMFKKMLIGQLNPIPGM
jgi:hypothetical protein